MRESECRTEFNEVAHGEGDVVLLVFREGIPPVLKLISELYLPGHDFSMPYRAYSQGQSDDSTTPWLNGSLKSGGVLVRIADRP